LIDCLEKISCLYGEQREMIKFLCENFKMKGE